MTLTTLFNALLFVVVGIVVYGCALVLLARALPGNLWRRAIEEKELTAAVVLGAIALALGWIVAAAVH